MGNRISLPVKTEMGVLLRSKSAVTNLPLQLIFNGFYVTICKLVYQVCYSYIWMVIVFENFISCSRTGAENNQCYGVRFHFSRISEYDHTILQCFIVPTNLSIYSIIEGKTTLGIRQHPAGYGYGVAHCNLTDTLWCAWTWKSKE